MPPDPLHFNAILNLFYLPDSEDMQAINQKQLKKYVYYIIHYVLIFYLCVVLYLHFV